MTMALPDLSVATVHLLAGGHVTRVWGPPGTGKTTTLAKRLRSTVVERGPDSAIVVSFTHTSAQAIAGRDTGLPDTAVGTLHSLAYRAIGGRATAEVALDKKPVQSWNARVRPDWQLSEDSRRGVIELARDAMNSRYGGDALLGRYDLLRARFSPREEWPAEVRRFAEAWENWKRQSNIADFTDMCLQALARALDGEPAPGNPQVLVGDEAQDFTPLETALMLAWGRSCDRLVLALDDDQSINQWRGGDPGPILSLGVGMDGEPQPGVVVDDEPLQQSYRVPAAIQAAALHWIGQIPPERRRAKTYRPREDKGGVTAPGRIYHVSYSLDDVETVQRGILWNVQAGQRTMVLASCRYMLNGVLKNLREWGIPYWNHYRPGEQAWNPLRPREDGVSTVERLYRYLVLDEQAPGMTDHWRDWTGDDVRAWVDLIGWKEAGLLRGAKKSTALLSAGTLDYAQVAGLFADPEGPDCTRATEPDLDWLCGAALASKREALAYPAAVARRFGPAALLEPDWSQLATPDRPQVVVGTIHAAKGGEADCSPPDEPILTKNRGWVPISDLRPESDYLISYDRSRNEICRGGPRRPDGYPFTMGSRYYEGDLLTITTPLTKTRVTPNHYLTVRWGERALEGWILYMMQRGNWWRLGITKLHRTTKWNGEVSHYYGGSMRARHEEADSMWIIRMLDSREEAMVAERTLAWQYGVPDMTFNSDARRGISSTALARVWDALDSETRAKELLVDFGMDASQPFWQRGSYQMGRRNRFQIRASNFLEGWMEIPTDPSKGIEPRWTLARTQRDHYAGPVYSLGVDPYEHYVSGGAIVHNCVYLSPSISGAGYGQWVQGGAQRDELYRQFYVGLTRARQTTIILNSTERHVPRELLCPPELVRR